MKWSYLGNIGGAGKTKGQMMMGGNLGPYKDHVRELEKMYIFLPRVALGVTAITSSKARGKRRKYLKYHFK